MIGIEILTDVILCLSLSIYNFVLINLFSKYVFIFAFFKNKSVNWFDPASFFQSTGSFFRVNPDS